MNALRLTVLIFAIILIGAEGARMSNTPKKCCFEFAEKQIPRGRIQSYAKTSQQCTNTGILFKTKRNKEFCASPSDSWVQDYMKFLDGKAQKK
ncbi:C-C motif chemokine 7 [Amia ocellicauda]|uniref:C-C motif chemokine 7 n=1 Tax=Amia ocellicauda TaxID=2972642 RepID=UPI003464B009